MLFNTKKDAFAKVRLRRRKIKGKTYENYDLYLGINPLTQKPERLYGTSRTDIEKKISYYFDAHKETGGYASLLSVTQIADAHEALNRIRDAKLDVTLTECVRKYIDDTGVSRQYVKTIGACYDEFFAQKPEGVDKKKTNDTSGFFVSKIGKERLMADITTDDIESYLKTNYGNNPAVTYNSHRNYIFTFFNWCANPKRRYIPSNPVAAIDKKAVPWKEPKYMKVADVEKLMRLLEAKKDTHPDLLAHAITNFFTGTRRAEILRMAETEDAAKVLLDDETIRIAKGKGYTKGRAPRTAHLMPNAIAWMRSFDYFAALKADDDQTTEKISYYAAHAGIKTFQNCGRHTFITMHVAAFGDPSKTQAMVGTSAKMRAEHYDGLATKKEGEAYFNIYPTGYKAG